MLWGRCQNFLVRCGWPSTAQVIGRMALVVDCQRHRMRIDLRRDALPTPRWTLPASMATMLVATAAVAASNAPQIGKPRDAPAGPSTMAPLPPAQIDNNLNIGGNDINAKQ